MVDLVRGGAPSTPSPSHASPHIPNAHFPGFLLAPPRRRYCRCRALGLLFGVTLVTATAGGGLSAMVADLRNLVTAIADSGVDPSGIVFVAAPAQAVSLKLLSGPNFDYRIAAANITPGTVIAVVNSASW